MLDKTVVTDRTVMTSYKEYYRYPIICLLIVYKVVIKTQKFSEEVPCF